MSKVLLWKRFVGGELDGEEVPSALLMVEGPVNTGMSSYGKRPFVICQQPILLLVESKMGTAEASAAMLRTALRSHPDATDEEP